MTSLLNAGDRQSRQSQNESLVSRKLSGKSSNRQNATNKGQNDLKKDKSIV
jgi:hypothetical protein